MARTSGRPARDAAGAARHEGDGGGAGREVAEAVAALRGDGETPEAWVTGLVFNEKAGDEVLRRVFTVDPFPDARYWLAYHPLPPAAAHASVRHPDPRVRRFLAENPRLPADVLAVLAQDTDARVRRVAVMTACEYGIELPVDLVVRLATGDDARLRYGATGLAGLPDEVLLSLAEDPDPRVRAVAIGPWSWPRLRPEVREAAAADEDPLVREAVAEATRVEAPLPVTVAEFLAESDPDRRGRAARTAPVDADLAAFLVGHEDRAVRHAAAHNPHVPTALALVLGSDTDPAVRLAVSLRADLTEEQRAAIAPTVPAGRQPVPAWVAERFGDPEAMRELAASGHVVLRRAVTCAPWLPPGVVTRLAADDDFFVRLMLCENDHAPHDLLVEMFISWDGLSSGSLVHRRNFARPGLARFADHADPRLRYAALFDPQAGPELVERLSYDPEALVRRRASGDGRLPLRRLAELLDEPDTARTAARNPSLPVPLMHRMLDLAGAGH